MSFITVIRDLLSNYPIADGLFRRLVWSRVHFPENEMRILDDLPTGAIDVAIDVGAAHASYAWILNRKSYCVFAFEPGVAHGDYLEKVVSGTRIKLVRAAVGAQPGTVKMYTPGVDSHALHSATLAADNPVVTMSGTTVREVPQVALDDFVKANVVASRSVDVLKVDVEGYELDVFRGAVCTLTEHAPLVFCEIEKRHNADCARVFELLEGLGYTTYAWREGSFMPFNHHEIETVQRPESLRVRLSPGHDPSKNEYLNNFVFQHPNSRIKVKQ
jgi:FkbM family methyltransferase